MTIKNVLSKGVAVASLAGVSAFGMTACEQVGAACQTAHGDFAVKLFLKSGTGECSQEAGGVFGVNSYNYPTSDGKRPDLSRGSVAIQAEALGVLVDDAEIRLGELPDPANKPYAKGDWSGGEPVGGVCTLPTMSDAVQNLPALEAVPDDPETPDDDESLPAEPAKAFKYAWSNVQFTVSPAATGTAFLGTLEYTKDGCTATYEAWGLYPAVFCGDAEGNPIDKFCEAEADPENGFPLGSGINPDFKVHCDPDLLLCMLTDRPRGD